MYTNDIVVLRAFALCICLMTISMAEKDVIVLTFVQLF